MAEGEIKGLREFLSATKQIQGDFEPVLAEAAREIARTVVAGARSRASTPQQRLAASTLNSGAEGVAGTVSSSAPFFAGAEFGGGNRPTTKQFPPFRGKRGYFLYPSMRANSARLNERWDKAIDEVMAVWDYSPGGL